MRIFFITSFLLVYTNVVAQEEFLTTFRSNIKPIETYFQNVLEDNSYIIYCSKNKLLLYIHYNDNYFEIIFEGIQGREKAIRGSNEVRYVFQSISLIDASWSDLIFSKDKYQKGYSDALIIDSTKGLISLNGLPTYFVYKENINKIYAEYILSMVMKPVPMDYDLYKFFISKMKASITEKI